MFEEIASQLSEQLGIAKSKITMDSNIVKDLGADSLDIVELLMTLEDNTGKTIPEDQAVEIKTVGDLIRVLENL